MKRRNYRKAEFPLENVRKFLEPGPIVLVSSQWKNKTNIMTMGWHTVMEFIPSLVGCIIAGSNHSFYMIKQSGECVINIPTVDMIDAIVGIGNSTGVGFDKFKKFRLTAEAAAKVKAPLIKECYANFECKLIDRQLIRKYNYFIFEVIRALVAQYPKYPKTVHYRGEGIFMVSGKHVDLFRRFKSQNL